MKKLQITSKLKTYDIIIKNHLLKDLRDYFHDDIFYVVIADDMIPEPYINQVTTQLKQHVVIRFPAGEQSKSLEQYQYIVEEMQKFNIARDACVIALGGGVTGDLSGFVAATYMRGIDYVQIPTTLLSQIDSSVGGKVAINTKKSKNSLGQFYPPSLVLIDPTTLKTLTRRQFNNGVAEIIKYGMIYSKSLFESLINEDVETKLEDIIYQSLAIKKHFVESDEYDQGVRQMLNFGHTFGHAYEAYYRYQKYYHGEAVALGMLMVSDKPNVKSELIKALKKYDLPIKDEAQKEMLLPYVKKDKKIRSNQLSLIVVETIGKAKIKKLTL